MTYFIYFEDISLLNECPARVNTDPNQSLLWCFDTTLAISEQRYLQQFSVFFESSR